MTKSLEQLKAERAKLDKEIEDLEGWRPKSHEAYWYIDFTGDVSHSTRDYQTDERLLNFNNYFKTREKAIDASIKVRALLLGLKGRV